MKLKNLLFGTILVSSILFAGETVQTKTKTWSFDLQPYIMLTNIDGDSTVAIAPTTNLNVDFGDILDNLDLAGMARFEVHHKSGWGVWIDYAFMDLSNDVESVGLISSLEVRQGVLEVFGMYKQELSAGYIEYLAGVRWWDIDMDLKHNLSLPNLSKEADWVDVVVGARYTYLLNDSWKFRVHGDIGGGSADFTAAASGGVVYTINTLLDVDVRYKGTWVDYDEGTEGNMDYFSYDTVTHGLIIGLNFKF